MAMTSAKIMHDANQSKNKVHPSELLTLLDQIFIYDKNTFTGLFRHATLA